MAAGVLPGRIATAPERRGLGEITRWVEEPLVVGLRSTDKVERMSGGLDLMVTDGSLTPARHTLLHRPLMDGSVAATAQL